MVALEDGAAATAVIKAWRVRSMQPLISCAVSLGLLGPPCSSNVVLAVNTVTASSGVTAD